MSNSSPLTLLMGLLLRNDDALDPSIVTLLRDWNGSSAEARELTILSHLQFYLRGIASLCPYYADTLSAHIEVDDWSWERFSQLPLTSRQTLLTSGEGMYANKSGPAWTSSGTSSTSGSTGTPILTHQTPARARLQKLMTRIWHEDSSRDPNSNAGFITEPSRSKVALSEGGEQRGRWSPKGAGEAYALSLLASPEHQLSWINRRKLKILATYPSNLRSLLNESERLAVEPDGLTHVVLSSEPIDDELVARAKEQWGAKVVGTYSSSELAAIALQDEEGGYRIQDASVWVEVLDAEGSPTAEGQVGRVVVTTLQEMLRPLVRYEVGDYAEVARSDSGELVLKRVVGRERTMVRTKTGGVVWPFFELGELAKRKVVRAWQLTQHRDLSLTMKVEANRALQEEDRRLIELSVREMSGGLPLTIQEVARIERTARGKFREVISELD